MLNCLLYLVEKISLIIREYFLCSEHFLTWVEFAKLERIDCLNYDTIWYPFAGWKAAAVFLNDMNNVIRIMIVMM